MSGTVFDSYIKSVYGSGSGMEYFDSIHGGDRDIFGGLDSAEILDDIEEPSSDHWEPSSDREEPSSDNEKQFDDDNESEDDNDNLFGLSGGVNKTKKDSDDNESSDDQSIIGYIKIGIHRTPIVDDALDLSDGSDDSDELTAPMEIQLNSIEEGKISPEDIGDMLRALD